MQHAINKQVFEFTCSNELVAKTIQNEFVHYTATQISDLIADILSGFEQENSVVTIRELEIDLGDIHADAFGNDEMLEKFRSLLSEKISGIRKTTDTTTTDGDMVVSTADANMELTKSLVLHGDVPWWADKDSVQDADTILQKLLQTDPKAIRFFLESQQGNADLRMRIATQYKPATKAKLYALVPGLQRDLIALLAEEYAYEIPSSLLNVLSAEDIAALLPVAGQLSTAATAGRKRLLISRMIRNSNDEKINSLTRFNLFSAEDMRTIIASLTGNQAKQRTGKKLDRIFRNLFPAQLEFLYHYLSEGYDLERDKYHAEHTTDIGYYAVEVGDQISAGTARPVQASESALAADESYGGAVPPSAGHPLSAAEKGPTSQQAAQRASTYADSSITGTEGMEAFYENTAKVTGRPGSPDKTDTAKKPDAIGSPEIVANAGEQGIGEKAGSDKPVSTTEFRDITNSAVEQSGQQAFVHHDKLAQQEESTVLPSLSDMAPSLPAERNSSAAAQDAKNDIFSTQEAEFSGTDQPGFFSAEDKENIGANSALPDEKHRNVQDRNQTPLPGQAATSLPTGHANKIPALPDTSLSRAPIDEKSPAANAGGIPDVSDPRSDQAETIKVTPDTQPVMLPTDASGHLHVAAAGTAGTVEEISQQNKNSSGPDEPGELPVTTVRDTAGTVEEISQQNKNSSGPDEPGELPVTTVRDMEETKESRRKDRQIGLIMKGLRSSDTALYSYLQKLPVTALHELTKNFRRHPVNEPAHRKRVNSLLNHPSLLEHNLIRIFATVPLADNAGGKLLPDNRSSSLSAKQQKALERFLQNSAEAQSLFVTVLRNLPPKESIVLQDIFQKKTFDSRSEKNLVRKILLHAPEKVLVLMNFLTSLPGSELSRLQPTARQAATETNWLWNEQAPEEDDTKKIYINNAGLCLIAPYLSGLFSYLGYIENRVFKNKVTLTRALYVLQYIATGKLTSPEYLLQLNKVLCGLAPQQAVALQIRLTKKEIAEADALLEAVVANWKALRNTSAQGLREAFIQRKGILFRNESSWTLQVEKKGHDMLLGTIPWGFNMIKLPWMKKMMQVEW